MLHALAELAPIDGAVLPNVLALAIAPALEVLSGVLVAVRKLLLAVAVLEKIQKVPTIDGACIN